MRRGTITLDEAEQQLEAVAKEQAAIQGRVDALDGMQAVVDAREQQVRRAERLLTDLRARLDAGPDDATRQAVVQALVRQIVVRTSDESRRGPSAVTVQYAFAEPSAFVTGSSQSTDNKSITVQRELVLA